MLKMYVRSGKPPTSKLNDYGVLLHSVTQVFSQSNSYFLIQDTQERTWLYAVDLQRGFRLLDCNVGLIRAIRIGLRTYHLCYSIIKCYAV